jgi:hypothetical protein
MYIIQYERSWQERERERERERCGNLNRPQIYRKQSAFTKARNNFGKKSTVFHMP